MSQSHETPDWIPASWVLDPVERRRARVRDAKTFARYAAMAVGPAVVFGALSCGDVVYAATEQFATALWTGLASS